MKESVLLTIGGILDALLGALLLAFPSGFMEALGMPKPASPFYPAVLGGVLGGIGLALIVQQLLARPIASRGVELPIITSLVGAGALAGVLVVGHLDIPLQGRIILWILTVIILAFGIGVIVLHWKQLRAEVEQAVERHPSEQ
jgi:hypothetical protein